MSVRLSAGALLQLLGDAPDYTGAYTMAGWVRTTGAFGAQVSSSDTLTYDVLAFSDEGLRISTELGFSDPNIEQVADGEWHFASLVRYDYALARVYLDVLVNAQVIADVSGRSVSELVKMETGADLVDVAYWRVWTAALSEEELAAEMQSPSPVRTADLWADWPLTAHTDLTDDSGNVRHLASEGSISTSADDPLDEEPEPEPEPSTTPRVVIIPAENRTVRIEAEARTATIVAEDRRVVITLEE